MAKSIKSLGKICKVRVISIVTLIVSAVHRQSVKYLWYISHCRSSSTTAFNTLYKYRSIESRIQVVRSARNSSLWPYNQRETRADILEYLRQQTLGGTQQVPWRYPTDITGYRRPIQAPPLSSWLARRRYWRLALSGETRPMAEQKGETQPNHPMDKRFIRAVYASWRNSTTCLP